jgi:hypothetical protein
MKIQVLRLKRYTESISSSLKAFTGNKELQVKYEYMSYIVLSAVKKNVGNWHANVIL